jgi:hypothetical protein
MERLHKDLMAIVIAQYIENGAIRSPLAEILKPSDGVFCGLYRARTQ